MMIRIRGPNGQVTLKGLEPTASLRELRQRLEETTGIPPDVQEILYGFPPVPLAFVEGEQDTLTLDSMGIRTGDSLTIRQIAQAPLERPSDSSTADVVFSDISIAGLSEDEQLARAIAASLGNDVPPLDVPSVQERLAPVQDSVGVAPAGPERMSKPPQGFRDLENPGFEALPDGKAIARRTVADDNSCLFRSVGLVIQGSRNRASELRGLVADTVLEDPLQWNEAVLGKDPAEYARWIRDPKRWGGAIELSIVSQHFGIEVAAFDIQTKRVDIYGQGRGYRERVLVVYDGLHYDALTLASRVGADESSDQRRFLVGSPRMDEIMDAAKRLVARYHTMRQFTDTANFTLRCNICKKGLRGEKEALAHAQTTGHANFSEY